MLKATGDYLVNFTKTYVDDEFEEITEHRANTVFMWVSIMASYVTAALLCWVLPGWYSVAGLVLLIPFLIAALWSRAWMRNYVPLPKTPRMPAYIAVIFVSTFLMVLGVYSHTLSVNFGAKVLMAVVGIVVGGGVGVIMGLIINKRQRARDIRRFEAELED